MELKEFVKKALLDLVNAVDEANESLDRKLTLISSKDNRTIEFDVAVSVEEDTAEKGSGGGEIRVLNFISAGGKGEVAHAIKNSTVSRVKFGVDVDWKESEIKAMNDQVNAAQESYMKS